VVQALLEILLKQCLNEAMKRTLTPAEHLIAAVAALATIPDPAERAQRGHELQDAMKASAPRVRALTDAAVRQQRDAGAPLAQIAAHLGLSVQRVSQMATGKHNGTVRPSPPLIYAFRIADEPDSPWIGPPDVLPTDNYETGFIDFAPAAVRNRFAGHRLEVRYGPVADDGLHPAHAYTTVNGRRVRATAALQEFLLAPD
jgi:hypothetical protein